MGRNHWLKVDGMGFYGGPKEPAIEGRIEHGRGQMSVLVFLTDDMLTELARLAPMMLVEPDKDQRGHAFWHWRNPEREYPCDGCTDAVRDAKEKWAARADAPRLAAPASVPPAAAPQGCCPLNDLSHGEHEPECPKAAPQEQQGAAAHGLVSEAFLRKAKERAAIAHRQPKKHDDRPRCSAKTRRGLPCTSPASQGLTGLCTSHAAQRWNIYVKQHPAPAAAPRQEQGEDDECPACDAPMSVHLRPASEQPRAAAGLSEKEK